MVLNEDEIGKAIARVRERVLSTLGEADRAVAMLTGGLPVYSDIGGTLAITSDGRLLRHVDDTGEVVEEVDERWQTLAFISAAERYPELAELRPSGSERAVPCGDCGGTGRLIGNVRCAECLGLGWKYPAGEKNPERG
jgi:hypothetical protein